MDRGAWWATVHGVTKSQTRLSDLTFTFTFVIHEMFFVLGTNLGLGIQEQTKQSYFFHQKLYSSGRTQTITK